jgi:hypothetical protein
MAWTKETPIPGKIVGCACCGGNKEVYPLGSIFAVGFGHSGVRRDGEPVYEESHRDDHFPTLQEFEDVAAADPDHDWRMYRSAPLREAEYQRHGPGAWVLVREGVGFA